MDTSAKRRFSRGGGRGERRENSSGDSLEEKVVHVGRCAKVMKGGRRFSFSALVVVGDRAGRVGMGYGRAKEVSEAVRKANGHARNHLRSFELVGNTIPHGVVGLADGGRVLLKPAMEGTGLVAGGGVRAVLELVGIKNVLSKSMRSSNALATVRATLNAMKQLRSRETIMRMRGQTFIKRDT